MSKHIDQIKAFFPLQTVDKDDTILRAKNDQISVFDEDIKDFCDILMDLMYEYDGVGLAAPQVGRNIRIIATTQWKETRKGNKVNKKIIGETVMVNPEIIEHSDKMEKGEEACLSVPGLCGDVERRTWIVLKYQDKKGKTRIQKYTGFSAVVIQHEIDHLNGILFIDKVVGKTRKIDEKSEY